MSIFCNMEIFFLIKAGMSHVEIHLKHPNISINSKLNQQFITKPPLNWPRIYTS